MTRNQLPEGVGKKIVEALKRQAEADITPVPASETAITDDIPLTNIEDLPELKFESTKEETESNENMIIEEEAVAPLMENTFTQQEEPMVQEENILDKPVFTTIKDPQPTTFVNPVIQQQTEEQKVAAITPSSINIPPNVAVLKNLIASLPVGVTKQTGAQIIRQTFEAMGLPMNSVLKEAQEVQEQLNSSTRECMLKIQEYKTNILQLEQSVQDYQKNVTLINDLVSLFLLTDRK
ncbi:hypothetical protein IJ182_07390 [bacterium]|nr:hypothetical protein [bacterium]